MHNDSRTYPFIIFDGDICFSILNKASYYFQIPFASCHMQGSPLVKKNSVKLHNFNSRQVSITLNLHNNITLCLISHDAQPLQILL